MTTNEELADLVKGLYDKIDGLELRISKLELLTKDVPEDHLAAIAAAVAAYLGEQGGRRQPRIQHVHHPIYTR